jgi:hypothetical protein
MDEYIYQQHGVLSDSICETVINYYTDSKNTYDGVTYGGMNKNIKDTRDLIIPVAEAKWALINRTLYESLYANLLIYLRRINPAEGSYRMFPTNRLTEGIFLIQKYEKNKGKYIYHNDFSFMKKQCRVITYIWYLNDVEEGGETEFWGEYRIKPEKGKLVLFPASWTFPHCGKMPISHDKYIITGWLYMDI